MAVIKLVENWNINFLRTQVRDSLMYLGEEAVLLSLYHTGDKDAQRCPRCSSDVYNDGENSCMVCYGTNFVGPNPGDTGVKDARRAWCMFSDHTVSEQYGQRGVMAPDTREVQCEPFPMLVEHDVIARVRRWGDDHTVLSHPLFYSIDAVTRNSLRTGNRFGQTDDDVIGQKCQCSWLPPNSSGIQLFPIKGVSFPAATIQGTPVPTAVVEPDTKVVFYPVIAPSGDVTGGIPTWEGTFTFTQASASDVWTIHHTLGHSPQVTIVVGGEEVDADVDYPDAHTVTISFAAPQSGRAELS